MAFHDDEEFSQTDSDDEDLDDDMEALRRACILTGSAAASATATAIEPPSNDGSSDNDDSDDEDDDVELVRSIQRRFLVADEEPLSLNPLCSLPPVGDDYEDDFETLRAIQRRFSDYTDDSLRNGIEDPLQNCEQVGATNIPWEKETSNNLFAGKTNIGEGFPDSVDASFTSTVTESSIDGLDGDRPHSGFFDLHVSGAGNVNALPARDSGFPKSAQTFIDAIKKNRSCQKFLRSKLIQLEARIEENKKLRQHVKILKDFQVSCRKRTGRALSQKKDARVQLISVPKLRANIKVNEKKVPAMYYGPPENSHVANYKMALNKFPLSISRQMWSKEENKNLAKGIKQQFQKMLLQDSFHMSSGVEGYPVDSSDVDSIITSIRDHDITPEKLRLFLPKVNWENLVSMYVSGRSGAECEARWRNCEDLLINRHPWTKMEDKFLLQIVQKRGISNWIEIAVSLGTNRTPFQCLARYQRSLNASILKSEWTVEDDDKLCTAVAAFGESDWQRVASTMEGRTGTQCSNRWLKTLHPTRQRVGTWTPDEDKRLKVAVMLFGAKNWRKIAIYVPGRTHVQCRERWVNCLDPALNLGKWSKEEDSRLKEAIFELGYCWSKVAACVPPRTDSQCRRRWKYLCPHEVPLLQAARKVQKAALIANFVDRESERPALGPKDFLPLPMIDSIPESRKVVASEKQTRKLGFVRKTRSKRPTREGLVCAQKISRLANGTDDENFGSGDDIKRMKQVKYARLKSRKSTSSSSPLPGTTLLDITNGEDTGACDEDAHRSNRNASGRRKRKSRDKKETKDTDNGVGYNAILKRRTSKSVSVESEASETVSTEVGAFGDNDVTKNGRAFNLRKERSSNLYEEVEVNTSFKEFKAFCGDDSISSFLTKRMMEAKLCAKNKNTDPTADEAFDQTDDQTNVIDTQVAFIPPAPCTTLVRRTSGEGVVTSGGYKNASSEERAPRCSTPDISDNPNSRAFVICRRNRPQRTRTDDTGEETLRNQLPEIEDGDDLTLASFIKQSGKYQVSTSFPAMVSKPCPKRCGRRNIVKGSKRIPLSWTCSTFEISQNGSSSLSSILGLKRAQRSRAGEGLCSYQISEELDRDGMPLTFFCNKFKKRRFGNANSGNLASSPL